ncbi:Peptidase M23 [Hyella patelloides LEGE 07179]|uniref:Peptidase M23 n=1 Tax=Hyella patelloides LEGE 07179 TaxID=945734 RepID=A0A563W3Y9_9CYAN|nr:M23 family metallopeptidase [Hyella patelloides]VEP18386.1 Peptidase M23 [Hyella patelloides LEGE 07179]
MYFKFKWYRLTIILIISCACFLGISQLKSSTLKASNVPAAEVYPTEIASTMWQNGFFPLENFQSYTSPFGYRRSPVTGEVQFHNGLDLAAPLGSYVRSWWSGKIVKVSQDNACGTHVIVKSGTWEHVYCHLKGHVETSGQNRLIVDAGAGIQLAQGQEIAAGTRIGRIGMTGRTTGPHLHWVLKHNGSYIDPASVLREMFRQKASLMPNSQNFS